LNRIEQWNERYRAGEEIFHAPSPLVVQFADTLAPGLALDLASGPGRNALYLAEHGWRVTAVDGSIAAIDLLRSSAFRRRLTIDARVMDLEAEELKLPLPAYDLVLSCYYLQRSLIHTMKAALGPGGLLIMIVRLADAGQPQGTPTRAIPGELRTFFESWRVLHYREGESEDCGHRRAVAQVVAQKPI
jgi:tellurite methyltransferase